MQVANPEILSNDWRNRSVTWLPAVVLGRFVQNLNFSTICRHPIQVNVFVITSVVVVVVVIAIAGAQRRFNSNIKRDSDGQTKCWSAVLPRRVRIWRRIFNNEHPIGRPTRIRITGSTDISMFGDENDDESSFLEVPSDIVPAL